MSDTDFRFGAATRRHLIGVVLYLHRFSVPDDDRAAFLKACSERDLRDFLAAVHPYLEELELALENAGFTGRERDALTHFAATYQDALGRLRLELDQVQERWDVYQVTNDARLNSLVYDALRGLELAEDRQHVMEGLERFLAAYQALLRLREKRHFPEPAQALMASLEPKAATAEKILTAQREQRPLREVLDPKLSLWDLVIDLPEPAPPGPPPTPAGPGPAHAAEDDDATRMPEPPPSERSPSLARLVADVPSEIEPAGPPPSPPPAPEAVLGIREPRPRPAGPEDEEAEAGPAPAGDDSPGS